MTSPHINDALAPSLPTRPGIYSTGSDTVAVILEAAMRVLIDEGAPAFTLRRVAAECGMKAGNVSYHFPRKEMLVQVLLQDLLTRAAKLSMLTLEGTGLSPEEALIRLIVGTLDDIESKQTTRLFTELWAMANHNEFIADRLEACYKFHHDLVGKFVSLLNPALSTSDVETLALYIGSSIEGATIFSGYDKPWRDKMPQIKKLAVKSLIHLVKTITPEEMRDLEMPT